MDAQKISEAAAAIKKSQHAMAWFDRIEATTDAAQRTIGVDTKGDYTMVAGHSEAVVFLRHAFEEYRDLILSRAKELAEYNKHEAEAVIRAEAGA